MSKYFRFLSRTVPEKYSIKTDSYMNEDVYTQVSRDEMMQFKLKRMPLYIDHDNGITVSKKVPGKPVEIKTSGKSVLGHVVDTFVTDKGAMLNLVEIPLTDDKMTEIGARTNEMKQLVISMILSGYLGSVSFCHVLDNDSFPTAQCELIGKVPLELSLTGTPDRDDSCILDMYYCDDPYLRTDDYSAVFKPHQSASLSGVDFSGTAAAAAALVESNNNIHEKKADEGLQSDKTTTDMASPNTNTTTTAAAGAPATKDEVARLREELETYRKKLLDVEPLANQYKKEQVAKQEQQKANFVAKQADVYKYTKEMLNMLNESKLPVAPEDKVVFDSLLAVPDEKQEEANKELSSYLLQEQRANASASGNPLTADDIYNGVESVMNRISANVVACARVFKYVTPIMEAMNKREALAAQNGGKVASGAGSSMVASVAAPKEPKFQSFEALQQKLLAKQKSLHTTDVPV